MIRALRNKLIVAQLVKEFLLSFVIVSWLFNPVTISSFEQLKPIQCSHRLLL
jgi:hypothetical protein